MKNPFVSVAAAVGLAVGVSHAQAQCVQGADGNPFECFTLLAGQTIEAGAVCVEVTDGSLVVSYGTTGGWTLDEVHLWVGSDVGSLPKNKSGNPVPGSFPYKSGSLGDGVTSYSFTIDLADLGFGCPGDDQGYVIAAHAAVRKLGEDGETYQTETGWSEGPRISPKGNWATTSPFTLTCDCDTIINPPTECWDGETAWADGERYNTDQGNWATYTTYNREVQEVFLFAGKTLEAGTVTFSAPDNSTGEVAICVNLNPGFRFKADPENLKVQGYSSAPAGNPSPGLFTTYKGQATGSSFCISVDEFPFYGVHVDVEVKVTCPEPTP